MSLILRKGGESIVMTGTVYGIGVGPGDPELLTIKAVKAIEKADIIIAPKTEKKEGGKAP